MLLTFVDHLADVRHRAKCRMYILRQAQVNNHPVSHRKEEYTWDLNFPVDSRVSVLENSVRLREAK